VGTRATDIWKVVHETLLGKPDLRGSQVFTMADFSAEDGKRFWQALGFPAVPGDEIAFTRRDVEALGFVVRLIEGQDGPDRERMLQMARTTGQALSRVANMHVLSISERVEEAARSRELSNNEAADRIAELAEGLVRGHEPFLGYIWRRHLLAAVSHLVASATNQQETRTGSVIGFADLVGFTSASRQMTEQELADVVDHFEKIIYQEVPDRGGRVIKTLGDEVMFSNSSAHAAAATALALASACEADDLLPHVRVGVASGPTLAWEGDLYGPTVNLAHRLVGVARPGTVIVSEELADKLQDDPDFDLVEIRDVKLKGIGRTKPWVLRQSRS
jgi:adenylate cyclase